MISSHLHKSPGNRTADEPVEFRALEELFESLQVPRREIKGELLAKIVQAGLLTDADPAMDRGTEGLDPTQTIRLRCEQRAMQSPCAFGIRPVELLPDCPQGKNEWEAGEFFPPLPQVEAMRVSARMTRPQRRIPDVQTRGDPRRKLLGDLRPKVDRADPVASLEQEPEQIDRGEGFRGDEEIGRASCRERVLPTV